MDKYIGNVRDSRDELNHKNYRLGLNRKNYILSHLFSVLSVYIDYFFVKFDIFQEYACNFDYFSSIKNKNCKKVGIK